MIHNRTVVRPTEQEGESELRRSSRVRTVLWYDEGKNLMPYICWVYSSLNFIASFCNAANAVFTLGIFTAVTEFTYLGKFLVNVNIN